MAAPRPGHDASSEGAGKSVLAEELRSRWCSLFLTFGRAVGRAQTDEIQVYTGEIDEVGQASLTLHNNYTPIGRKQAEFPGAIVPQGSYNGVAEWAYGVTEWFEAGLYLPLYSVTREGRPLINGGKIRFLFAEPHVAAASVLLRDQFRIQLQRAALGADALQQRDPADHRRAFRPGRSDLQSDHRQ